MNLLLTGGAGFIGSHLAEVLLRRGHNLIIIDDFNDYYSPRIKENNLRQIIAHPRLELVRGDIRDRALVPALFSRRPVEAVIHLAARAGVRPSLTEPFLYQDVNVGGTLNLLEAARLSGTKKFVFASSSSIYGNNPRSPWRESDLDLQPESPYGVTKLIGEHLCRIYHRTYGLKAVMVRFFTVYGPRQRPDMAIHNFTKLISEGKKVPVFGDGSSRRDYTHISDIISGILSILERNFELEVFNLGGGHSTTLTELIEKIGRLLGKPVCRENLPPPAGDVNATWADVSKAKRLLGYRPNTSLDEGLQTFVAWFKSERDKLR